MTQLVKRSTTRFLTCVRKFLGAREGASLVEYGLLLALIAVICIGAISVLGKNVSTMFATLATTI